MDAAPPDATDADSNSDSGVADRPSAPHRHGGRRFSGLLAGGLSAAVLGAVSAAGDWIWAHYLTDGALLPALVHGALFFLVLAAVLAISCADRRGAAGLLLWLLPLLGLGLAAVFYPLAWLIGYLGALMVTWSAMWLGLALARRAAGQRDPSRRETSGRTVLRAAVAALGSGLAFWAVSGMWTAPAPGGPDLVDHGVRWTVAFLPGMLALLAFRGERI